MREVARSATVSALILLLSNPAAAGFINLKVLSSRGNPLGIDFGPAPPPDEGPPLSAHASRDPSLLPYQIAGIIGGYFICLCLVGIALYYGRKHRQGTIRISRTDVELVQPHFTARAYYPSPISPVSGQAPQNFSWPSPEKERTPYVFPSPAKSPVSQVAGDPFDRRVLEADRDLLNRNLEDIYAHVMEQEEAKAAGIILKSAPIPSRMQAQAPVPALAPQRQNTNRSNKSNMSKADGKSRPAGLDVERSRSEEKTSHSRTSSIISSLKSPRRKGIRSMRISSPIATPLSATFPAGASDEEPLSPRYYSPPPPPPAVPTGGGHPRQSSADPSPISPTKTNPDQLGPSFTPYQNQYQQQQQQQQQHRYNPSYSSARSSRDPLSANSATSQTPLYPINTGYAVGQQPQSLQLQQQQPPPPQQQEQPLSGTTRALPFRAYEPSNFINNPNNNSSSALSHVTKTTVLERTSPLSPSGLKTPWSAGAVPYSPYQPFTPMVPITPRLVTREERKKKEKEEKKKGRAPALEMIKSDDELWDSGY